MTSTPASWRTLAACANTDTALFFDPTPASVRRAKALCAACPVSRECATAATVNDEQHGVWGGSTELERYLADPNTDRGHGPAPAVSDRELVAMFTNADPATPAAEIVRHHCAISRTIVYECVARAVDLGVVERRGRGLFPVAAR